MAFDSAAYDSVAFDRIDGMKFDGMEVDGIFHSTAFDGIALCVRRALAIDGSAPVAF